MNEYLNIGNNLRDSFIYITHTYRSENELVQTGYALHVFGLFYDFSAFMHDILIENFQISQGDAT